ncbi:MAG: hypothetical protein ACRETU_03570 [Steroidobacterales bacterium]
MPVLRAFTFTRLMTESERALWRTETVPAYYRHPIAQLLEDVQRYQFWEFSHARLMRNIALAARPPAQILALRETGLRLVHRRGLFDFLRSNSVRGAMRAHIIEMFYGPIDYRAAVINEHRHFLVSASSAWCTEVLFGSLQDETGRRQLDLYDRLYSGYFELFGQFVAADHAGEPELASALKPIMLRRRTDLARLRGEILKAPRPQMRGRRWTDSLLAAC